jgi:hypothetical protein
VLTHDLALVRPEGIGITDVGKRKKIAVPTDPNIVKSSTPNISHNTGHTISATIASAAFTWASASVIQVLYPAAKGLGTADGTPSLIIFSSSKRVWCRNARRMFGTFV